MPRPRRVDLPGIPQHLIVRGNNRCAMFFSDQDRSLFMRYLEEGLEESSSRLHAFVLMTNHVHLLATGGERGSLSRLVQSIGRRYARYVNRAYKRTGTLFEGRFKSSLVDSAGYFLTCMRYIELNPVRAGLVRSAGEYWWSSYRHNASGEPGGALTPHPTYLGLGGDGEARAASYRGMFAAPLTEIELQAIRSSAKHGLPLGSPDFRQALEKQLGRSLGRRSPGRPRRT